MLKKLAAYERQHRLDRALQECGRLVRTGFMIDWLETPALRRRCHAGLNKSEQRHALANQVCTYRQGRLADRSREALEFRASGLNLVVAAIVYWNSTDIADAVVHLLIRRGRAGLAPGAHLAGRVGAHRLLGRLPVGPSRRAAGARAGRSTSRASAPWPDRCSGSVCRSRCLAHNQRYAL
jgi:hypothetical protein